MDITRPFISILRSRIQATPQFLQIIIGPRQVGKTTGVQQLASEWTGSKVFASADLPSPPTAEWILGHWNRARDLAGPVLLIFDEIQKVPRWSEVIKALFDEDKATRKISAVLLGSASLALSSGLNESLAGRFEKIEVPHWSINECSQAFNWDINTFLKFGGYPGPAALITDVPRWQNYIQNSIIEPVISRDIFSLVEVRKPALFRQVFEMALAFPSQQVSYQKFVGQLQDAGNVTTVKHYLELLQEAFLIKLIPKFSGSIIRERALSPKILTLAPALLHGFKDPNLVDTDPVWRGRVAENAVGIALCQNFRKVSYWQRQENEVDFVVEHADKLYAIEVKSNRPHKLSGISAFLKLHPTAIPVVIDRTNLNAVLSHNFTGLIT